MNSKKKKRGIFDDLFGGMDEMFEKFGAGGGGMESGYSVNVTQTPEGTKVHAKAGKGMDASQLRKSLQQQYPNTTIEIEGDKPLIREISTKTLKEKE